jgi:hypothetical protein
MVTLRNKVCLINYWPWKAAIPDHVTADNFDSRYANEKQPSGVVNGMRTDCDNPQHVTESVPRVSNMTRLLSATLTCRYCVTRGRDRTTEAIDTVNSWLIYRPAAKLLLALASTEISVASRARLTALGVLWLLAGLIQLQFVCRVQRRSTEEGMSEWRIGKDTDNSRWGWGKFRKPRSGRLCGLVIRIPGYRSKSPGFDFRHYYIFWVAGLEHGPLSLVSTKEGAAWKKK